jgi:aspartate kinase
MITDNHHQNANPMMEIVEERIDRVLRPALAAGITVLTEGFIGATRGGAMTTLGRGGSDFTATILASILHADEVWMWTRVDGIMSADPQLVPNAHVIESLSYEEIRELSYFGVRLLHPRAVEPLLPDAIPMHIRNPAGVGVDQKGTVIHAQSAPGGLKAVSAIDGLFLSTRQDGIALPEVLAQINHLVGGAATGPVITVQSQGRSTLVFVVPTSEGPAAAVSAAQRLSAAMPQWEVRTVKVIAAMGALMQTNTLPGIRVLASAQGGSNRRVLAVAPEDMQVTVRYLHQLM